MGEEEHGFLQGELLYYFRRRKRELGFHPYPEQRLQVAQDRFRIPDLCLFQGSRSQEQVFRTPPFLCIEVLSRNDTFDSLQDRIDDYLTFGVPYVWVINPRNRKAWVYTPDGAQEVKDGILRAGEIQATIDELFSGEE